MSRSLTGDQTCLSAQAGPVHVAGSRDDPNNASRKPHDKRPQAIFDAEYIKVLECRTREYMRGTFLVRVWASRIFEEVSNRW